MSSFRTSHSSATCSRERASCGRSWCGNRPEPGRYWLDVGIAQQDGPEMTEPPGRMLRELVDVKPSPAKGQRRGKKKR